MCREGETFSPPPALCRSSLLLVWFCRPTLCCHHRSFVSVPQILRGGGGGLRLGGGECGLKGGGALGGNLEEIHKPQVCPGQLPHRAWQLPGPPGPGSTRWLSLVSGSRPRSRGKANSSWSCWDDLICLSEGATWWRANVGLIRCGSVFFCLLYFCFERAEAFVKTAVCYFCNGIQSHKGIKHYYI